VCGLSGILTLGRSERDTIDALRRMHAQLAPRGPDGQGFLLVDEALSTRRLESLEDGGPQPRVALAFRWLAIQDTGREAIQPMPSADGTSWLAFNGEIYNFVELRAELAARGHQFRTHGDTEVILAAWSEWGAGCFTRFRGMWAILLVDLHRRLLVGSRDRFGIKPLFYSVEPERILFASEIKAILAAQAQRTANQRYLYEYLHGHRSHLNEETFYSGIFSVPAATMFELPLDGSASAPRFVKWWEAPRYDEARSRPRTYDEAAGAVEEALTESVRLHVRADVKVGTFLSGGLDSAAVTGILHALEPRQHDSYTLAFDRSRYAAFDESQYVDDFVEATQIPNHRTTMDAAWLRSSVREITRVQEEPLIASTVCAQYRAFELARRHGSTVVLDGQGSDEIFGGYGKHELIVWRERLLRGRWGGFAREARILSANHRRSIPSLLWGGIVRPAVGNLVRRLGLSYRRYNWIDEGAFRSVVLRQSEENAARNDAIRAWPSHFDREMYRDLQFGSLRPLFLFSDRSGMAHSVEARLPYVDHPLVELAFTIPAAMKVGFGHRKRILRDASRKYVPASIVDRPDKMGFITPESEWLRRDLRDDVLDAVRSDTIRRSPFLRAAAAEQFVRDYIDGRHQDFRGVWRLYALRQWLEVYGLG